MSIYLYRRPVYNPLNDVLHQMHQLEHVLSPFLNNSQINQEYDLHAELTNTKDKFLVSMDVTRFKPEELKINVDGRVLSIEGHQEHKDDENFSQTTFVRKWIIPEDVDPSSIQSALTDNGQLTIEAKKKEMNKMLNIPIEVKKGETAVEDEKKQ